MSDTPQPTGANARILPAKRQVLDQLAKAREELLWHGGDEIEAAREAINTFLQHFRGNDTAENVDLLLEDLAEAWSTHQIGALDELVPMLEAYWPPDLADRVGPPVPAGRVDSDELLDDQDTGDDVLTEPPVPAPEGDPYPGQDDDPSVDEIDDAASS